jgi:transcriptional regulator with XRE-family HTH domain
MKEPVPELAPAIGRRMRALRDEHDVTADTVAAHARRVGLGWQRSTVATIEAGRRRLTGEELLLLPLVLSMALPVNVTLRDLLDIDIALSGELVMTPAGFRQLLDEGSPIFGGYRIQAKPGGTPEEQRQSSQEVWRRIEQLWPQVHGGTKLALDRLRAVERAAGGDAEQNAARALGCSALDVSAVAHRLWGHGLTAERELRLAADDAEPAAATRGKRGHVTRTLLDELAPLLAEAG